MAPSRVSRRKRSVGREALGAAVLLGVIIFLFSLLPASSDGYYRRDRLGRYMCEVAGTTPGTPQCVAVAIGGWFVIVVTVGLILKLGRDTFRSGGRDDGA